MKTHKEIKNTTFKANFINELKKLALNAIRLKYTNAYSVKVLRILPRSFCVAKPSNYSAVLATPMVDHGTQSGQNSCIFIRNSSAYKIRINDWCSLAYIELIRDKDDVPLREWHIIHESLSVERISYSSFKLYYFNDDFYRMEYIKKFKRAIKEVVPNLTGISHILPRALCIARLSSFHAVFVIPKDDREQYSISDNYVSVQNRSAALVCPNNWYSLAHVSQSNTDCVKAFHVISDLYD